MRISDWSSDVCSSDLLRLGRAGRDGVRQERPFERQFLGFGVTLSDLQQQTAHGLDRLQCLVALTNPATEDHHLLELRLHSTVDTTVGEEIGRASCRERVCQYV